MESALNSIGQNSGINLTPSLPFSIISEMLGITTSNFIALNSMKKLLLLLLPFIFFIPNNSKAQQRILLLNGKYIYIKSYEIGEEYIKFKKTKFQPILKNGKQINIFSIETSKETKKISKKYKTRTVNRFDVFSIENIDSSEVLIYSPTDSLDYTVEEARAYIQGEQIAREYYSAKGANIASSIIGISSSLLSFYALPVPMINSLILGRFNPKKMHLPENFDLKTASTEPFIIGYEKAARNTKIQQSLKWGYISLGVGLTGLIIYGIENH